MGISFSSPDKQHKSYRNNIIPKDVHANIAKARKIIDATTAGHSAGTKNIK